MEVVKARKSDIPDILEIWKELMDFHVPFDSRNITLRNSTVHAAPRKTKVILNVIFLVFGNIFVNF